MCLVRGDRIKVEVDRAGGGSADNRVADSTGENINPATEEKQDEIISAVENISVSGGGGVSLRIKQLLHTHIKQNHSHLPTSISFMKTAMLTGISSDKR